jgi:hypothetical protein
MATCCYPQNIDPAPLIVFVHAPKTAGSTVGRVLQSCSYRGREQCQNIPAFDLLSYARHGDWLSGHLPRDVFEAGFAGLDRATEYFSTVRHPVAQLVSFLNWHLEFSRRVELSGVGPYPGNEPIVSDIRATDFSDELSIIALLEKYADVLLNSQSFYIIGRDFESLTEREFYCRLASYRYIACEHNLPDLYRAFGFTELPQHLREIRENVARRHFDDSAFKSPAVQEFLGERHAHDFRLYRAVREMAWAAASRRQMRTSSFRCVEATPETFEEERYLDANHSVVDAVRLGHFASGREHYDLYGRFERRLMRAGPTDPFFSHEARRLAPTLPPDSFENLLATEKNFDEQSYLRANPDVAEAVALGRCASGRAHFDRHGRLEGRLIRRLRRDGKQSPVKTGTPAIGASPAPKSRPLTA